MRCDVGKRRKGWRMNCDIGEVTERLEDEQQRKGWRMTCDVGKTTEGLENYL